MQCFTANFSSRKVYYGANTKAHNKSKITVFCMGNMQSKYGDFKCNLQCFTANFNSRNDLYCAIVNAQSKIIICGPRRKQ